MISEHFQFKKVVLFALMGTCSITFYVIERQKVGGNGCTVLL